MVSICSLNHQLCAARATFGGPEGKTYGGRRGFQNNAAHFSYHDTAAKNQNARNGLLGDIIANSTTDMFGKSSNNLK